MSTTTTITKTDSELQHDVMEELKWYPEVEASHIAVTAKDGVVTLSGYVSSYVEKWAAEKAAKRVIGVRAVANDIEVRVPGEDERTDEEIAADAVDALKWNLLVPAKKIKVIVSQGRVTLEGEVHWQFQRRAAEETVRELRGVRDVVNLIKVKPRLSARKVKARIEEALRRSAEVDAGHVEVDVEGDQVILRGTVRSWAEREEAERQAWSAPGVSKVINLIKVES